MASTQREETRLPDRYRLVRPLGEGGTAEVVLVEDRAAGDARRALKILRADLPAWAVEAFSAEFHLLATLVHPGLARVFDRGVLADGRAYYTAEWVEGRSLAEGETPLRDACLAIANVCRTLAYLHSRGYRHNDVKPGNIVIPHGRPADALLLDFGLAGLDVRGRTPAAPRGGARLVVGTPGYIAPERLASQGWDQRADLWSVGATLYRLLSGRRAVHAERAADALAAIEGGLEPLRRFRPDLPEPLLALVDRLLARAPAARPAHATEIVTALAAALGEALPLETPGSARCHAFASVLVGRDRDVAEVMRLYDGAVTGRGPGGAVVWGASGLGKTRFLREIAFRAEGRGLRVAQVGCRPRTEVMAPLVELGVRLGLPDGAGSAWSAAEITRAAGGRAVVLVVDDAHHLADAAAAALLGKAASPSETSPRVLVVLAGNRELAAPEVVRRLDAAHASGALTAIELGPLDAGAVERLLDSLFGPGLMPASLKQELARRSGGNPLLLEEMVTGLVDDGVIFRADEGFAIRPAATLKKGRASERLEAYFRRRVEGLPEEAKVVLAALGCLGGQGRLATVAEVAGTLLGEGGGLRGLGLVAERLLVVLTGGQVQIAHAALGQLALEGLAPEPRRGLFSTAARALAAHGAADALVATACREAGDHATAATRALGAAESSLSAGEGHVAVAFATEALADLDEAPDPDLASRAHVVRADAQFLIGRPREALADLDTGFAMTRDVRRLGMRSELIARGLRAAYGAGDDAAVRRWSARLDALGTRVEGADPAVAAEVARAQGTAAQLAGRVVAARAAFERAATLLGEAGRPIDRLRALTVRIGVEARLDPVAAAALGRDVTHELEARNERLAAARARNNWAHAELRRGQIDAAAEILRPLGRAESRPGGGTLPFTTYANLAEVAHLRGRWAEAHDLLDRAFTIAAEDRANLQAAIFERVVKLWREGELSRASREALRTLEEALAWERPIHILAVAAAGLAAEGLPVEAQRQVRIAEELARRSESNIDRQWVAVCRAYAGWAAGDGNAAQDLLAAAIALEGAGIADDTPTLRSHAAFMLQGRDRARAADLLDEVRATVEGRGGGDALVALDHPVVRWRDRRTAADAEAWLASITEPVTDGGAATSLVAPLLSARSLDEVGRLLRRSPLVALVPDLRLFVRSGSGLREMGALPGPRDAALESAVSRALDRGQSGRSEGFWTVPIALRPTPVCAVMGGLGPVDAAAAVVVAGVVSHVLLDFERRTDGGLAGERGSGKTAEIKTATRALGDGDGDGDGASLVEPSLTQAPHRDFPDIVGHSPAIEKALSVLERVVDSDVTVLLLGETGTGKEVFARTLHGASPRASGPFVAVNVAAIPETLFEAELFGFRKGAFTGATHDHAGHFEQASGGLLFLDEVGELPPPVQAKLLRAIEEGRIRPVGARTEIAVDVRLVTATNKDLAAEVAAGRFRADLYFRLNVVELHLPPLRERPSDLPLLVRHFLARFGRPGLEVSREAMATLGRYEWPGNLRELENELQRASVMAGHGPIMPRHLSARVRTAGKGWRTRGSMAAEVAGLERRRIREALTQSRGNQSQAARLLGLSREGLRLKLLRLKMKANG